MLPVSAIDIGGENQSIHRLHGEILTGTLCSIHSLIDGRVFEYAEGNVVPLCWEYVRLHEKFWFGSEFIFIEKQISKERGKERMCILIHAALYSIFLTLYQIKHPGAPKPIADQPRWWKQIVGVPEGCGDHEANKKEGIRVFTEWQGPEKVEEYMRKWGKVDDLCESALMCKALLLSQEELREKGRKFESNHKEWNGKRTFKKDTRWIPLSLLDGGGELKEIQELRSNYLEIKKKRRRDKVTKENNRTLKKFKNPLIA